MCVCVCVYACVRWVNIGTFFFFPFFPPLSPSLSLWLVQVLDDLICASWMETNRHKRGPLFYHGSYFGISCDVSGFFFFSLFFFKVIIFPLKGAETSYLLRLGSRRFFFFVCLFFFVLFCLFMQQIRIWGILKIEAKNQDNECCIHTPKNTHNWAHM